MRTIVFNKLKIPDMGLFFKLFIPLLLAMVIPTVAISTINYRVSKEQLETEVGQSNLDTLKQTMEAIDAIMQTSERMSYHLVRDNDVQIYLTNDLGLSRYVEIDVIRNMMQTMETYIESSPYIESIIFHSVNSNFLVSSESGIYQKANLLDYDRLVRLAEEHDGTAWITPAEQGVFQDQQAGRLQMIKFLYKGKGQVSGFVQIQMNKTKLLDLVQKIFIRKSGFIAVMDENGNLILNEQTSDWFESLHETPWMNRQEGFTTLTREDRREMLVSFTTSTYNGWKYIATVPVDELTDKSSVVRTNITVVCAFFAVVAVIVSLGTARGLYSPIRTLQRIVRGVHVDESKAKNLLLRKDELGQINAAIREISTVKEQYEKSLPELKHYFLQRLAVGDAALRQDLDYHAEFFELPTEVSYLVWRMAVEKFSPTGTDGTGGFHIPAEAAAHIQEAVVQSFDVELSGWTAVDGVFVFYEQHDRLVGVMQLAAHPADAASFVEACKLWGANLRDLLSRQYGYQVTMGIGNVYAGLHRLNESYEDASRALKFRVVLGTKTVIHVRDVDAHGVHGFEYDYLKRFDNALSVGRYDQAAQQVWDLRDKLKNELYSAEDYVFCYRNIVNLLIRHLKQMHQRIFLSMEQQLESKFLHFETEFSDMDEATKWLNGQLESIAEATKGAPQINKIVRQAMDIIHSEYFRDPGLSELAERINVTPAYLSRIFKEELGVNFKEYITSIKLEKAKQLLAETDQSIESIAKQVGYQNHNQFARMFKKHEQISAMEYRSLLKTAYQKASQKKMPE